MSVKLQISHDYEKIQLNNKEYGVTGLTDYTPAVWNELSAVNWYVNEREFIENKKTYIYTGSKRFGELNKLHQIVMMLWYGKEAVQSAYLNNYIIEHHNNDEFDCHIRNLSFASNDLNLAKAHTFDKTQPLLLNQAAVNFYKDFETKQYQITVKFTRDYILSVNGKSFLLDSLFLLYEDNFRVVYTDANRIVDELLEIGQVNFKLLSYKDYSFVEGKIYIPKKDEKIEGIQIRTDESGNSYITVSDDTLFFFNRTLPDQDLYKNNVKNEENKE
ncbi:MAG: hypothetical protein ACM3UU_09970 [Ignavibacteriales bacterium]